MATIPHDIALGFSGRELPFASYAQIVRMLVPLAGTIAFYNERGEALWISDGVEEPELRARIEAQLAPPTAALAAASGPGSDPIYVLPVRDSQRRVRGLLALVCRNDRTQRGLGTIERLLAPLIEILSHAWPREPQRPAMTAIQGAAVAPLRPAAAEPPPWPALLRHTLLLAAQRVECAFAAVVAAERVFTLSHRGNAQASDLEIEAAIASVAPHMIKLMRVRREAVLANQVAADRIRSAPFKFLVHPLRNEAGQLLAVMMLFRARDDRDFVRWDLEALSDACAGLPSSALVDLAPAREVATTAAQPGPAPSPTQSPVQPANVKDGSSQSAEPRTSATPVIAPAPMAIDARLRAALQANAFELHVQRISPLGPADRAARHEVLLRLHEADRLWAPRAFLSAAETAGLMPELDQWVLRRLLQTLRKHGASVRAGGLEFCINVSAQSLAAEGFEEFVIAEVCRSSIPPGLLVFEVAEAHAIKHPEAVEVMAARLRDLGCRLALDNCRAGFDTLSTVRKWPISCVKLDGSLVRTVVENRRSESLVRAVVQLAAGAGVETVGQCVETNDVCEKLLEIGVDFAQGFHLSKPQPLERLFRPRAVSS